MKPVSEADCHRGSRRPPVALFLCWLLPFLSSHVAVALTNNLALTPPEGWNDWNSYGWSISEFRMVK